MKRFTETKIWDDDWWIEMPDAYKFFWFYIKDHCDHAGIISPQTTKFRRFTDFNIDPKEALLAFNEGKERVVVLDNGKWILKEFISFQNSNELSRSSSMHRSIIKILDDNGVDPSRIGIRYVDSKK